MSLNHLGINKTSCNGKGRILFICSVNFMWKEFVFLKVEFGKNKTCVVGGFGRKKVMEGRVHVRNGEDMEGKVDVRIAEDVVKK